MCYHNCAHVNLTTAACDVLGNNTETEEEGAALASELICEAWAARQASERKVEGLRRKIMLGAKECPECDGNGECETMESTAFDVRRGQCEKCDGTGWLKP